MPHVIERTDKDSKPRYTGMYRAKNGKVLSAGTYSTHERAYEIAEEERHISRMLDEVSPSDKARMTIEEHFTGRFLPFHSASPSTLENYAYSAKNHIYPYIGHLRISEVNRETFYNLLKRVLPAEEATHISIRATRKVLSAMCQMAWDEGYRDNNPVRSIHLPHSHTKPVLGVGRTS